MFSSSSNDKTCYTDNDTNKFEKKHNFAKETFVTKVNRLENDYKRAHDKLEYIPASKAVNRSSIGSKKNFGSKDNSFYTLNNIETIKTRNSSNKKKSTGKVNKRGYSSYNGKGNSTSWNVN